MIQLTVCKFNFWAIIRKTIGLINNTVMFTRERLCLYSHSTKLIVWAQGAQFKPASADRSSHKSHKWIHFRKRLCRELEQKPLLNTWKEKLLNFRFWKVWADGKIAYRQRPILALSQDLPHLCSHISLPYTLCSADTERQADATRGLGAENPKDPRTGLDFLF